MKSTLLLILVLLMVLTLTMTLPTAYAKDYAQWSLPEGAKVRLGKGEVYAFHFSPDGTQLSVASAPGIWRYDTRTGEEITLIPWRLSFWVHAAAFSSDGAIVALGAPWGTIGLWDAHTGEYLHTLTGHRYAVYSVSFSPDGRTLASGGTDKTIRLWDVPTGRELHTLIGHTDYVNSVSFSPDGQTLASGSRDSTIRLWDVPTGRELRSLTGHTNYVSIVSFSPDGRTLASGSWDSTIRLWDVPTGRELRTVTKQHMGSCWPGAFTFSPDGQTLISESWDSTIRLWDVPTGTELRSLTGHTNRIRVVKFSADGTILASWSWDMTIRLWDGHTGRRLRTLTEHTYAISSVSFSPDGRVLASGGLDETIRLWDVPTGRELRSLTGHTDYISSVSFSPDGRVLASGGLDETIRLWDVPTGRELRTLIGHTGRVESVSFSPDGRMLASASWDSTIRLWDVPTGTELRSLTGHTNSAVLNVVFSPDGRVLASGGLDETIRLWDVPTGRELRTLIGHTGRVESVSFSPDGRTLASASWDRTILLWDVQTGKHKGTPVNIGFPMGTLAFSPNRNLLAAGGSDGRVFLLNLDTAEAWEPIGYQPGLPQVIAFSADGSTLASAGIGGIVILWDLTPNIPKQDQLDTVRLVYFRPSDRLSQLNIETSMDRLVKDVQQFYAQQMYRHGRKTFTFETDANGNAVVHHVDGQFTDAYYRTHTYNRVREEISKQFDISEHIYLVAVDVSSELVNDGNQGGACGIGGGYWNSDDEETWRRDFGGLAVIPASGVCFSVGVTAHELGHTFGLEHDFRDDTSLMGYGAQSHLSHCSAEWLSAHRYFNTGSTGFNQDTMFEIRSSRTSQLQFQITDADGLHQAQLLIPTAPDDLVQGTKLHSCQMLNGNTSAMVEFAATELTGNPEVILQLIDVNGNITKQTFPVEADSISRNPDVPIVEDVATVSLSPSSISSAAVGEHLTLSVMIAGGVDVAGYQVEVDFDVSALRYVSGANADYLPVGVFAVPPLVNGNRVTLAATSLQDSSVGAGTLATVTFEVIATGAPMPILSDAKLTDSDANFLVVRIENVEIISPVQFPEDVNGDGIVSLNDLTVVATRLGEKGENIADVNDNGVVDAADLLLIAIAIEQGNGAPSLHATNVVEVFTAADVRHWLWLVRQEGFTDAKYQRGILLLEQLLAILTPKETALLSNYPNPFNPETWIPYHLSQSADIHVSIYAADGKLVRVLSLGHQAAGIYDSRGRAAYWDGRNDLGESVASGVYFYTLTAGEFTATRKMLIRK